MWNRTIGLIVILILPLFAEPPTADAQQVDDARDEDGLTVSLSDV